MLYELLIEEVVIGQNTIEDELQKPQGSQDPHYLMGQSELNVVLQQAIDALEQSGLIDEDMMVCRGCGNRVADHQGEPDGEETTKRVPASKLN